MMGYVYIPVNNSEEEVRLDLDRLPPDAVDILEILKAEQAPLGLWLIIAREYFKQGKVDQFLQILVEGSSEDIDKYYSEVKYERIAILNALGAYYCYLGKIDSKQREHYFGLSTQYYNKSKLLDMHEPSHWIGTGQLLLAAGNFDQATARFKIVLDGDRDNIPALLGQACSQFHLGHYTESLELYKRALRTYPNCPAAVRLGIGFCRYKLNQFEKARQAFERVLQLDPENVEALVALGIMELQANDAVGIRRGVERMQQAFEIYPYCATALNYLANHFFFTGQHFLVEQLTEAALDVTAHGPTKAHSFYNLARSYHSKGDFGEAGRFYLASVQCISKPQEFVLPYYGLGQVLLQQGKFKDALMNFEKVLEVYPENCGTLKAVGHLYIKLKQTDKAVEVLKKVTKLDTRDAQAFLDLGELLISSDSGAALEAYRNALNLLKKHGEEIPVELLNNIGVLHFEKGEFESAELSFKEALGAGVWISLISGNESKYAIDACVALRQYNDPHIFHRLQEDGVSVDLPWTKVTAVFNLGRLFEETHNSLSAVLLYRLILFKYPDYADAFLRLAAVAKSRNDIQLSIELVGEALKLNDKSSDGLSMLGGLEIKNSEWVKAKATFRAASEATDKNDSYALLCLGNWNYFAALEGEKRKASNLEAIHLDKAGELYLSVLKQHRSNLYAANGAGMVRAEKGQFDVAKDMFTQVLEAASGNIVAQMPDVWINLAHVYFAQGNFTLAIKMYQNCLRKFLFGTDSQVLLYLARTYYEAEQWQDCKKTLLRAIHLAPTNYALKFNIGVVMQKFSASTLNKPKKTAEEVRSAISEVQNAVRVFSQLAHSHGFDEKKIDTHVEYCKDVLEKAKVHQEVAEREEQANKQRVELARQVTLAEEARRKAEEQRKRQLEKRKQEEELRKVKQMEEDFQRVKEQWKSTPSSKRKDKGQSEDEEGEHGERKKKRGGKRRKKDKSSRTRYDTDEGEADKGDEQYGMEEEEPHNQGEDEAQDFLANAGLEDPDADDDGDANSSMQRRRRALSESDDDDAPVHTQPASSPIREDSAEPQGDGKESEVAEDDLDED